MREKLQELVGKRIGIVYASSGTDSGWAAHDGILMEVGKDYVSLSHNKVVQHISLLWVASIWAKYK